MLECGCCITVLLIHVMASLWFEIGYIVDMTVSEMQLYTGFFWFMQHLGLLSREMFTIEALVLYSCT